MDKQTEHEGRRSKALLLAEIKSGLTSINESINHFSFTHTQIKILPQCPGHRFRRQSLVGRLSAHWPPQTAPRRQTPAAGPM